MSQSFYLPIYINLASTRSINVLLTLIFCLPFVAFGYLYLHDQIVVYYRVVAVIFYSLGFIYSVVCLLMIWRRHKVLDSCLLVVTTMSAQMRNDRYVRGEDIDIKAIYRFLGIGWITFSRQQTPKQVHHRLFFLHHNSKMMLHKLWLYKKYQLSPYGVDKDNS